MREAEQTIVERVEGGGLVLTDGGVETRLMYEPGVDMDPDVQVAALVGDAGGEALLRGVYAGYVSAAGAHGLPVVIGTPTFRASRNPLERSTLAGERSVDDLNAAAVAMQRDIATAATAAPVFVAGVLGPAGDAYLPDEALDQEQAARYHREQAESLARAGVDLLFAATFPSVGEAAGVAEAMAATGLPGVVSFVLSASGQVLDGSPLDLAVEHVDQVAAPSWFSLSCVHPSVAHRALHQATAADARVREVKANASALTPDELVRQDHPVGDEPEVWATAMWALHEDFGVPVLGGCCGTDDRHIERLAALMAGESPV